MNIRHNPHFLSVIQRIIAVLLAITLSLPYFNFPSSAVTLITANYSGYGTYYPERTYESGRGAWVHTQGTQRCPTCGGKAVYYSIVCEGNCGGTSGWFYDYPCHTASTQAAVLASHADHIGYATEPAHYSSCPHCYRTFTDTTTSHYCHTAYGYYGTSSTFYAYPINLSAGSGCTLTTNMTYGMAAAGASVTFSVTKPGTRKATLVIDGTSYDLTTTSTSASKTFTMPARTVNASVTYDYATPTYTGDDITVKLEEGTLAAPITTTSNGTKTFTSSNTAVATIDSSTGAVTLVGTGTTTITLSTAKSTTYAAGSKSIELTVTKLAPVYEGADIVKTYGDASFDSGLSMSTGDGMVSYSSSNTNVATIDNTGTVTIVGAGETTLTISSTETAKYSAGSKAVTLTVNRANASVTFANITKTFGAAPFDLDFTTTADGAVSYTSSNTNVATVDSAGTVRIQGAGTTTLTITIAQGNNYNTVTKSAVLTVNKATPVILSVNTTAMTYGQSLSDVLLSHTATTEGTVAWQDGSIRPSVADSNVTEYTVVFTPTDTNNFNTATTKVKVTVNKQTPTFTPEQLSTVRASGITYGQSLANSSLSGTGPVDGTFAWEDSSIRPSATDSNTAKYNVIFTPNDLDNYTTQTIQVSLPVAKATPVVNSISASGITYGQSLADSTLTHTASVSGSVAWVDSSIKPTVADSNNTAYSVLFTPNDTVNYATKTVTVTLTVAKATPVIDSITASGITYGDTLNDSTLVCVSSPNGSAEWVNKSISPSVSDSEHTEYDVLFTPADTANYTTVSTKATLVVLKKTPVFSAEQLATVRASGITYGQSLADSTLIGETPIAGTLSWVNPEIKPTVSDSDRTEYNVLFTPTDTDNYNTCTISVRLNVAKATPLVSNITASELVYGQSLSESSLTGEKSVAGTFTWGNGAIIPSVSDSETIPYNVVFTPTDTANYNSVNTTTTLKVIKATPTVNTLTATGITYGQSLSHSALTYTASVDGTVVWEDANIEPIVADSNVTEYNVIFTPTDTTNYNTVTKTVKLTVSKQTPTFTSEQQSSVTATSIIYGQALSDSRLSGTGPVSGTFTWEDDSIRPAVSDSNLTAYTVIFTPDDTANYTTQTIQTTVSVAKATPTVDTVTATGITYGQSLSSSALSHTASVPGTVAWQDDTIKPTVSDSNTTAYTVVFTPSDTTNYNVITKTVTLNVIKATPTVNTVAATGIIYGQSLSDSRLTHTASVEGTVAWQDDSIKPFVADSDVTAYTVIFTPTDTANYNTVTKTVKLTVTKRTPTFTPEQLASIQATDIIYGQTLNDSNITGMSPVTGNFDWEDAAIKPSVSDSNVTGYNVIFMPTDTSNYSPKTIQVSLTVLKATPTVDTVSATGIIYGQSLSNSSLSHTASVSGTVAWQDNSIKPTVADSDTTNYTVVFTPTDITNYNIVTKTVKLTVTKQTPTFTPEQLATVRASGITYGQSLASSTLTGTGPIEGTFTWQDSTIKPTVADSNTTNYNVVFTPTDIDNYTTKVITTKVEVTKQTPTFTAEQLVSVQATGITYGQSLSNSTLSGTGPVAGTFTWQDSSIKPSVSDSNTTKYNVVFTPNDISNYTTKVIQVSLAVAKATPTINSLTASDITYGQSLASSMLIHMASVPGTVAWQDSTIEPLVSDSGLTGYTVIFTPNDTVNYNTVTKTVKLGVSKQTPTFTAEQLATVRGTGITYGQALSNSSLTGTGPVEGTFAWEDDTIKPTVADSNTTKYNVVFTPTDTANYSPKVIQISLSISKATPTVTTLSASDIIYGQSLAHSALTHIASVPGIVAWQDNSIMPAVSDSNTTNYTVVFTPDDTANYNTVMKSVKLSVVKQIPTFTPTQLETVTATGIIYGQSLESSVLTGTGPIPGTFAWEDTTIRPTVGDSNTTEYNVVFTPTDTDNYNSKTIKAKLQVSKATPVVDTLTASDIVYGQALANSMLTHTASVSGTVAWEDDTIKPAVPDSGITAYTVVFTPDDTNNYNVVTKTVKLTVTKQTPVFSPEQTALVSTTAITYGQSLANSIITGASPVQGTFAWENGAIKPKVSDSESTRYTVIFTPDDTTNYNVITLNTTVKVNIATPVIESVTGSSITYGQSLADSTLTFNVNIPGTVTWLDDSIRPSVLDSGVTLYTVVFSPEDTDNYRDIITDITITVNKCTPTIFDVVGSEITYNQSLANSTITGISSVDGTYAWNDSAVKPSVPDSDTTEYDLLFTPDDTDNYTTVPLKVTIKVNKDTPVISGSLETTEISYEQTLKDSIITGNASVQGTFEWKNPEIVPAVSDSNSTLYEVVFKPTDNANYNDVELTACVKVVKATVPFNLIDLFNIQASEITYGQILADSTITGESTVEGHYEWVQPFDIPSVTDNLKECKFVPNDTDNYNGFECYALVPVAKIDPILPEVHGTTLTYGQKLEESEIVCTEQVDGTFEWKEPDTVPSATTEGVFTAIFTPTDTDNFNVIEVDVPIIVNKASLFISVDDIEKAFGDAPFDLGAKSLGTITYVSANPDIITVDGSEGTIKGVGTAKITATATINDNYEIATADFVVTVKRVTSEIVNVYPERPLVYGESLSDVKLIGEANVQGQFKWDNENYCPKYSDNGAEFSVTFIPDDSGCASATTTVKLTVVQKDPEIPPEEILELSATKLVYGESLRHSTIVGKRRYPGEYVWQEPDTVPSVTDSNVTEYAVVFVPDDDNYATVIIGTLTVEVEKAQTAVYREVIVKELEEKEFGVSDTIKWDGKRIYTSSDPSVATVDENGVVTLLRKGETYITVTVPGTENYAECQQIYCLTVTYNAFESDILDTIVHDEEEEDEEDGPVPTGVALEGVGVLTTSTLLLMLFKKKRKRSRT